MRPWLTDVRRSYLDQGAIGYLIYMVGAVTAFLAAALALSDAQAGLHSSAMAVGMIGASLISHRLDDRSGVRAIHFAALAVSALAALLVTWAPAFAVTLVGAAGVGFGCGLLLGHVNSAVSASGGVRALIQLTRSTFVSMLLSVTVPVVMGLGIAVGVGWQLVVVPVVVLVGIAAWATRSRADRPPGTTSTESRLPREFWLPWVLTVLVVCLEFGILFWASTVVERSTGVSLADATLTISVYIGGIIVGRGLLSTHAVGRHDPVWLLRGGLLLTFLGSTLVWMVAELRVRRGGHVRLRPRPGLAVPHRRVHHAGHGAAPAGARLVTPRPGVGGGHPLRALHPGRRRGRRQASSPPGCSSRALRGLGAADGARRLGRGPQRPVPTDLACSVGPPGQRRGRRVKRDRLSSGGCRLPPCAGSRVPH